MEEFRIFVGLTFNMEDSQKNEFNIHHPPNANLLIHYAKIKIPNDYLVPPLQWQHPVPSPNGPAFDKLYKIQQILFFFLKNVFSYLPWMKISMWMSQLSTSQAVWTSSCLSPAKGMGLNSTNDEPKGTHPCLPGVWREGQPPVPPKSPEYIGASGKVVWELV